MRKIAIKSLLVILVLACGMVTANATTPYAHAYTYFNSSGQVVGGEVLFCNGGSYHTGTLNTQYGVFAEASCTLPCKPSGYLGGPCGGPYKMPVDSIVPGTGVVQYVLPGIMTIDDACLNEHAQCLSGGAQPTLPNYGFGSWTYGTGGNSGL